MVTKREPRSRPKKRPAAKKTAAKKKVANSKIQEATKAAQDSLGGQADADRKKRLAAYAAKNPTKLEPRNGPMATSGAGIDPEKIAQRDVGTEAAKAANQIAGLVTDLRNKKQAEKAAEEKRTADIRAQAAAKPQTYPAADPSLYGNTKKRAANLSERLTALDATVQQQKRQGQAVWMGLDPNAKTVKIRRSGPQRKDEFGGDTTEEKVGDLILTKNELLSWLTDDSKVSEIKAAAEKAGYTIGSYEDIAKLWSDVVSTAAQAYSTSSKKVTPFDLIKLRGKYLVNGRPADKVTTTTNIDEMPPETARMMIEKTAADMLGRAPTKQEVDDFVAKAQTIAKQNPTVTKTTQKIGLDGNVTSTVNSTTGGGASDKAQVAALDAAKQSEDYAAYQAAGNYFPMLFEALRSPV